MHEVIARIKRHVLFRAGRRKTPEAVARWEARHGVLLPAEYREFLIEIGEGAFYPFGDLVPLGAWWNHLTGEGSCDASLPWLQQPFALPERFETHEQWRAWRERWTAGWQPWAGTIALTDEGCGMMALLVLNGAFAGRVCFLDFPKAPWLFPQPNVLEWFEACLEARRRGSFDDLLPRTGSPIARV